MLSAGRLSVALRLLCGVAVFCVALLGVGSTTASAAACTTTWTGGDGAWGDSAGWDHGVPGPDSVACITQPGDYAVFVDGGVAQAKELHVGGASGSPGLSLDGGRSGGSVLHLGSGASTIGPKAGLYVRGYNGGDSQVCVDPGGTLTNEGGVQTAGHDTAGAVLSGQVINRGSLEVLGPLEMTNSDGCGPPSLANSGTVFVSDTGHMDLWGAFTQTAGTISKYVGGTLVVHDGHVAAKGGDGSIAVQGTSVLDSDIGRDVSLSIAGPGTHVTTSRPIVNAGHIRLFGSSSGSDASLDATGGTLTNTGWIDVDSNGGPSLALGSSVVNRGHVTVHSGAVDSVCCGHELRLSNYATFRIAKGATAHVGRLTQRSGTALIDGTLDAAQGETSLVGGVLMGFGTVVGAVDNATGIVRPGFISGSPHDWDYELDPGRLTIDGAYTQHPDGALYLDVVGPAYSQLAVSGTVRAGGELKVHAEGLRHESFAAVTSSAISGRFDTATFDAERFAQLYGPGGLTLAPYPPPRSVHRPRVTGKARPGRLLLCQPGPWSGDPTELTYQWKRDGAPIRKSWGYGVFSYASSAGYVVHRKDVRHKLSCAVTAVTTQGSGTSESVSVTVTGPSRACRRASQRLARARRALDRAHRRRARRRLRERLRRGVRTASRRAAHACK